MRCSLYLQAYKATHNRNATDLFCFGRGRLYIDSDENPAAGVPTDCFEIFTAPGSPVLEKITVRASPSGYTGSQAALAFVQRQIRSCVVNHTFCGDQQAQSLPTRLIDFRDPARVRLWETSGARGRYAALSYCRGRDQNLKTTTATYLAHTNRIPETDLPKTFQDAFDFCRKLDIEFIWIDSLCIIQDSVEDWQAESARMGDVYSNAFITVAASASESSHGGCYQHQQFHSHKIAQVHKQGLTIEVFSRKAWNHPITDTDPNFHVVGPSALEASPLLRRAWAFQERLLAACVIHFTTNEIMWECREHAMCECMDGVPTPFIPISGQEDSIKVAFRSKSCSDTSVGDAMYQWEDIVGRYSQR